MFGYGGWFAMEIGDPEWMNEVGWPLLFFIGLLVASLYIWSYISRTFDQMRAKEGRWVDADVAIYLEKMVKVIILMLLTLWGLYILTLLWPDFKTYFWTPAYPYIVDIVLIIFVFLISMLIVRILRRFALKNRRKLSDEAMTTKGTKQVSLLALSYVIYVAAVVISIIIIISLIPNLDLYKAVADFISTHGNILVSVFVIFLAIFFVTKLVDEILEDFKFKTKKFNPRVIDLFKRVINYVLWSIAILLITYSLFVLFGLADTGLLLIGLILIFVFIGLAMSYHTLRNIFAGLALMGPDLYDLDDRITVNEEDEGDVIQKNLMFTELRLLDGTFVNIPNAMMIQSRIFNLTRSGRHAVVVPFQVSFSIPQSEVVRIVNAAIAKINGLSKEVPPIILAKGLNGNVISYQIEVFAIDVNDIERIRSELIIGLQEFFHSAGMEELV